MNINVTLMFSVAHYEAIANAYIRGLERRAKAGNPIDSVASVASVFVSRVETLVDKRLDDKLKVRADEAIAALRGTAAIAGTRLIYQRFKEIFGSDRFKALAARGARVQRPLWASTGTKNPAYSDIKYVQELIGPDTVNTMPPATMDAYRDHGEPRSTLEQDLGGAREIVKRLAAIGIDLNEIGEELQKEGVDSFNKSFIDLLAVIKGRRNAIVAASLNHQEIHAASWQKQIDDCYKQLDKEEFPSRLWRKDATLWKKDPAHQAIISNALGWLAVPALMAAQAASLREFAESVRKDGFRDIVLLGMGGSSLCPEVLARTFYSEPGFPRLHVLDSTVPAQLEALEKRIDTAQTLFVVSTKSGGTVETLSHCAYFFDRVKARKGVMAGRSFVAITDPGTNLEKLAAANSFRHTFLNPHDIGGRYSALSYFGLVPAALIGMDVDALLDRATRMQHSSAASIRVEKNTGVSLGAALGALFRAGRDKVTLIISPPIATFGLWLEQLIAESTGKEETGLIPISDEPMGVPGDYGDDRIFAYLRLNDGFDPRRIVPWPPSRNPARRSCASRSKTNSGSAKNSCAGKSRPPPPARSSASMPSISPTCRKARTTPRDCSRNSIAPGNYRPTRPTAISATSPSTARHRSRESAAPPATSTVRYGISSNSPKRATTSRSWPTSLRAQRSHAKSPGCARLCAIVSRSQRPSATDRVSSTRPVNCTRADLIPGCSCRLPRIISTIRRFRAHRMASPP